MPCSLSLCVLMYHSDTLINPQYRSCRKRRRQKKRTKNGVFFFFWFFLNFYFYFSFFIFIFIEINSARENEEDARMVACGEF